jgi:hypothetical protein
MYFKNNKISYKISLIISYHICTPIKWGLIGRTMSYFWKRCLHFILSTSNFKWKQFDKTFHNIFIWRIGNQILPNIKVMIKIQSSMPHQSRPLHCLKIYGYFWVLNCIKNNKVTICNFDATFPYMEESFWYPHFVESFCHVKENWTAFMALLGTWNITSYFGTTNYRGNSWWEYFYEKW